MIRAFALALAALVLGACATLGTLRREPESVRALVAQHRARAHQAENDGRLRRALEEWKITQAIAPDDPMASAGQARVQARIVRLVAERLAEGKAALARGSQVEARRKLLAALALDPGNREAFTLLQTRVRDVDFIVHTVKPGDTLVSLANRYYGDTARSEVIWDANRLAAHPRLAPGSTLKIPAIAGVPWIKSPRPETSIEAKPTQPEVGQESEVNPLIAEARDALDRADYAVALTDLDKFLAGDAANREGLELKKTVLYRYAGMLFDQKNYEESYRLFGQLARVQPDYEDVGRRLVEAKTQAAEQHYREGIRLYREEHLKEAITEWQAVLDLEPRHANARKNIEQTEKLLQSLEQRQKK